MREVIWKRAQLLFFVGHSSFMRLSSGVWLLWPPVQPELTYWGFYTALRELSVKVAPHDTRRTYMQFLREASIPRIRRELYLGHGPRDVSDLYEWHDQVRAV